MLKNGQLVPSIQGNDGLQHRRQIICLPQRVAPLVEPGILVPVEIVNHRVFVRNGVTAGTFGTLDRCFRPRQQRIDGGIVDAGQILRVVNIVPLPFRIEGGRWANGAGRLHLARAGRCDVRCLSQGSNTLWG